MAAVFKSECGKESCFCTFLLFDIDLAKEWFKSFRNFLDAAKTSLKSIDAKALLMPWRLKSLAEHECCFQQWCILQLLVGVAATLAIFVLFVIWNATETVTISFGSIIVNTLSRFAMIFLATWIMWFSVIAKHGCCCAIACCCLGKPNILVVSIVEGLFALSTLMTIIEALDYGHVLLIFAALFAFVHLVTQVYVAVEAFVVWLKSRSTPTSEGQTGVVGAPVILGRSAPTVVKVKQAADTEQVDKVVMEASEHAKTDEEGKLGEEDGCAV